MSDLVSFKKLAAVTEAVQYAEDKTDPAVFVTIYLPAYDHTIAFQAHLDEGEELVCIYCPYITQGQKSATEYFDVEFDLQDC